MEINGILLGIIVFLFSVIWGLLFYIIRKADMKASILEQQVDLHNVEIANHQIAIHNLEKKMWGESKLAKVVQCAVENEFTKWENKLMKEGRIDLQNKEK